MKTYIYPQNLRSTVKLWFWNVHDFCILCFGVIVAFIFFAKMWTFFPMAVVICYAVLTLRMEDNAVIDYLLNAVKYFCISQKTYFWEEKNHVQK